MSGAAVPYHDPHEPLLPGEEPNLAVALVELLGEEWLHDKNMRFGGKAPAQLLGTSDEYKLRNLLRTLMYAGIS